MRNVIKKLKISHRYNHNLSPGFTLIELVVVVFIFSIMIAAISGIVGRVLYLQRTALITERIQENAILILESMAKEIRVSDFPVNACGESTNCTTSTLAMNHPINGAVSYRLSGGNIIRNGRGQDDIINQTYDTIINSAQDVNFTRLNFMLQGLGVDCRQPRVTIVTSIKNRGVGPAAQIDVQTTVTSRDVFEEFENPQTICP